MNLHAGNDVALSRLFMSPSHMVCPQAMVMVMVMVIEGYTWL